MPPKSKDLRFSYGVHRLCIRASCPHAPFAQRKANGAAPSTSEHPCNQYLLSRCLHSRGLPSCKVTYASSPCPHRPPSTARTSLHKSDCHSERSEEPPYFVFAFAVARSLTLYIISEFALVLLTIFAVSCSSVPVWSQAPSAWRGTLQDDSAHPVSRAKLKLDADGSHKTATTAADGSFAFDSLVSKTYTLSIEVNGRAYRGSAAITIPTQAATLTLTPDGTVLVGTQETKTTAGGEQLTSKAVSEIPLNKRDFSQLL